jgi:hypothetical protein
VAIVIQGATVTVPEREETAILVPQSSDAEHLLLNIPYPSTDQSQVSGSCPQGAYLFTLRGAKTAPRNEEEAKGVLIDPIFSPIIFKVETWKPLEKEKDYFAIMHLPGARMIRALGPPYEVQFAGSPRPAHVPLTEILEFPVRDMDDVRLVRSCGKEQKIEKPLTCQEMRRRYKAYFKQHPADSPDSERPYIEYELQRCSANTSYLFVGIGLDPALSHDRIEAHGRNFFNHKILPEIYGGEQNVPADRKIVEKGYGPGNGDGVSKVRLVRASFGEQPLYVPVAMTENCTSPGGIVLR